MGLIDQVRTQHRMRTIKTLSMYLSFIGLGLVNGMIGPTILDLQVATGVSYEQITWVFPTRAGGYALGAMMIGFMYKHINPLFTNFVNLMLIAISVALIPFCDSLIKLLFVLFFSGMCSGMLDSASNTLTLHIWGKENQPFMQALHLSFGVGGLIAPLIASPFLLPYKEDKTVHGPNSTDVQIIKDRRGELKIQYAYGISTVYCAIIGIWFLYLFVAHRKTPGHPSREKVEDDPLRPRVNSSVKKAVIAFTCLFMLIYLGLEIAMGNLLTTFAVKSGLQLPKVTGAYMTSVYWACFTFFRVAAVMYIDAVGSYCNIIFELSLVVLANVFLLPFGNSVEWCLWTGVALMGLGISSIWASMFGLIESYTPVTSRMSSSFTTSACLGEFVFPFIMGYLVEDYPQVFLWIIFGCTTACCILFAIISQLCRRRLLVSAVPAVEEKRAKGTEPSKNDSIEMFK